MQKQLIRLLALAAFGVCTSANAAIISLFANLTPFEENPTALFPPPGTNPTAIGPAIGELKPFTTGPGFSGDPRPVSFGFAEFTLNTDIPVLTMRVTINNIDVGGGQTPTIPNDNLVAAHIHASATPIIPGQTAAGVVWGFFGTPFNDADNDVVFTPNPSGLGGTFEGQWDATEGNNTTLVAQLGNILAGRSYINFHTTQFAGGEIRGQLRIPEPGTLALIALALAGIYGIRRNRQNAQARQT